MQLRRLVPALALAAGATAAAGPPHAPEVPRFARIDVVVGRAFPLRSTLHRAGALYLTHDGPAAVHANTRLILLTEIALDGDDRGTPRRPRLLCEDDGARVAVHVDAADLATVTRREAVLLPADLRATTVGADTPGVHLPAGSILAPVKGASTGSAATLAMHYRGLFLEASGVIAKDDVDVVYMPDPDSVAAAPDSNGELIRNVSLSAQPGGPSFARIAKAPRVDNQLLVRRMGAPVHGSVLVRYDEDDVYAIGWVPADAVRDLPSSGGGWGEGGLLGDEADAPEPNQVHLTRGTLLADPAGGEIVGVVEADHAYHCEADCTGPAPVVSVYACTGEVRLRARRPGP